MLVEISTCFTVGHMKAKAVQLMAAADFDFSDFYPFWNGELFGCVSTCPGCQVSK
jgi:hypothetical protein